MNLGESLKTKLSCHNMPHVFSHSLYSLSHFLHFTRSTPGTCMSAPSLTRKSQVGSDFWDLAAMIKGVSSQWERGSMSSVAVAEFKRVSRSMTDMTVFSSNCWCWAERSVITLCDRKGPNKINIARISGRNLSQDHLWVLRIQSLLCLKVWYFASGWLPTRVYYLWYILIAVLLTFLTHVKSKTETSQSSKRFQQLTRETTDKTAGP